MPRGLHNWNYKQVIAFLKSHGFAFHKELKGSHELWIKLGSSAAEDRLVEVNFTHGSYPLKTLKLMVLKSGIAEEEWIQWTR